MTDIKYFFNRTFEVGVNESLFFRNYILDESQVIKYIEKLLETPISAFLDYIVNNDAITYFNATAIVQYSSLKDATYNLCQKFEENGDEGTTFIEIGQMLLNDGIARNIGAYRKYGENHVKAALELGLVQVCYDHYYLSCLGKVYCKLNDTQRTELLRRTVLRNLFIQRMLKLASAGTCSIEEQLSFLSASTIRRRLPNVKSFFQLIRGNDTCADNYLNNITEMQKCCHK